MFRSPPCTFQFTHPGGVRRFLSSLGGKPAPVSIHAPGRGATAGVTEPWALPACFNSRTREGCDVKYQLARIDSSEFQFTHPGGVRRPCREQDDTPLRFQFTHPGGVRLSNCYIQSEAPQVSIHAPGRGATRRRKVPIVGDCEFQFTHPGGVRRYGAKLRIMGRINKRNLRLEVLL